MENARSADRIYTGNIITMDDRLPKAQAVAVLGGRILSVGSAAEVAHVRGENTQTIDLGEKALLPGFIDGHSHFFQVAMTSRAANVSAPPVGPVGSIETLLQTLRERVAQTPLRHGDWLVGYGYDGSSLADGREATRDDLDTALSDVPVVLIHVSGHGCLMNSAALRIAGIDANTPTPAGGVIVRKPGTTEPTGLLMENAWGAAIGLLPKPTHEEALESIAAAQIAYASNGYTTAQDAPVIQPIAALYREFARRGRFIVDLVAYADAGDLERWIADGLSFPNSYRQRLRVGGVKIVLDGSPQGRTAYFTQPYLVDGPGGEKNYRGTALLTEEALRNEVHAAYEYGAQVLVHCNGDAAIDMVLDAHRAAGAPSGRRTTIVHSQFVRKDQLEDYARNGFVASFFTNHAFFWGDLHVKNLGRDRAYFLSPMKTARNLGVRTSNHSDFFVTPLDPLFIAWSAVNRLSRSGRIVGPDERIAPIDAFKALTIDAAYQYFEEDRKGSIVPGKLADFVILDRDPLEVDPAEIKDLRVVETIKEGTTIFEREAAPA